MRANFITTFTVRYSTVPMALVIALALALTPYTAYASQAHAESVAPDMTISIGKSTYHYCENLTYVVTVSNVTGGTAIAHIIDEEQKKSQPIPIPIEMHENMIRAPFPFEKSIFPTGTYWINMTYSGANASATFDLQDDGRICIPVQIKQIAASWLSGTFSDGFFIDAISKSVDPSLIYVPFEINQNTIYDIRIPQWMKQSTYWWITGEISDHEIAGAFDYMLESGIIYRQTDSGQSKDDAGSDGHT